MNTPNFSRWYYTSRSNSTQIHNGDLFIDAHLAIPETPEKVPATIVIQEIFGVNAHVRNVRDRLAKLGHVALWNGSALLSAPAIYQRLAPGSGNRLQRGRSEAGANL